MVEGAQAALGCKGGRVSSGMLADPCQFCLRHAAYRATGEALLFPAVAWFESQESAGYACTNHLKAPKRRVAEDQRREAEAALI